MKRSLTIDRRAQCGFTLIELMVAITLVAGISVGMLMAIRTSLLTMQKVGDRLQSNRRVVSVQQILSREIGGVMPVAGQCGLEGPPNIPIFSGTSETLRLVSVFSMTEGARGYPRILEFQVAQSQGGGVRLIANEHLYSGPLSTAPFCIAGQVPPVEATPASFVVADHLAYCRISYHEMIPDAPLQGSWIPAWTRPDLPSAVRIEMAQLAPNPSQLPAVSLTVPIHVTRDVLGQYDDR